ncbi:hypothetical protein [Pseudomonas baetica]|uniref:hypothetical protein n=1 Tax=Pseudomonas baetica TaxID=674054 RepID=UPI00240773E8|nr:hypothetical protein [Pseudomonas baetica]MDF9779241.1 hypothetical protein [Pseudomonas baetica]
MSRYKPITGIDCNIPALLIDTHAPIDVLHENADHRIRLATQFLEALIHQEASFGKPILIREISDVLVLLLRDGCDLMDVIRRRLLDINSN